MSTPLITWACIVGLFIIILLVRLFSAVSLAHNGKRHLICFGSEREEFFIPGDPDPKTIEQSEYDDFEDQ